MFKKKKKKKPGKSLFVTIVKNIFSLRNRKEDRDTQSFNTDLEIIYYMSTQSTTREAGKYKKIKAYLMSTEYPCHNNLAKK